MKKIVNYFLQGLLYIVPIIVTLYVVYWTFKKIDSILPFQFPGLGIIVIVSLIVLIGYLGSSIIVSPLNSLFQRILEKAPLIKIIYSSVKDLMSTFIGKKKGFKQAVFVKIFDNSSIERIGFITNEDLKELNINEERVLVYIPHSYNFSGNLFVVKKKNITPINAPSSEIMKLIVSGGVADFNIKTIK
tara:strand:+ start:5646 stop:6209 length:564 start_codon:yes stop_codon:yes gene_type:complete